MAEANCSHDEFRIAVNSIAVLVEHARRKFRIVVAQLVHAFPSGFPRPVYVVRCGLMLRIHNLGDRGTRIVFLLVGPHHDVPQNSLALVLVHVRVPHREDGWPIRVQNGTLLSLLGQGGVVVSKEALPWNARQIRLSDRKGSLELLLCRILARWRGAEVHGTTVAADWVQ